MSAGVVFGRAPKTLDAKGGTGKPLGSCGGWAPGSVPKGGAFGYTSDDIYYLEVAAGIEHVTCVSSVRRHRRVSTPRQEGKCLDSALLRRGDVAVDPVGRCASSIRYATTTRRFSTWKPVLNFVATFHKLDS